MFRENGSGAGEVVAGGQTTFSRAGRPISNYLRNNSLTPELKTYFALSSQLRDFKYSLMIKAPLSQMILNQSY